jgi:UDP-N-acetylglucosamine transferase subunit ALG13
MNLCSDDHEEICYEGRQCPLCAKMDEHKQELAEKESTIDNLRNQGDAKTELIESIQAKLNECLAANPVAQHTHELEKGKNVW